MKSGANAFLCFAIILICFGHETAYKLLTVNIKSEAGNDQLVAPCCGHATIRVNGKEYSKRRRGYNVVVVNGQTGVVESSKAFDTYGYSIAHHALIAHLHSIPKRRLVLVAIGDSAGNRMSDAAYNALIMFGARNQLKYKFRNSYALLGWSGPGVLDAVSQVQQQRYKGPSIINKVLNLPVY